MNDRAAFAGEKLPFNKVGLGSLCNNTNRRMKQRVAACLPFGKTRYFRAGGRAISNWNAYKFHVTNENPHDALGDALAEAEVYRAMVTMDLF